MRKIVTLKLIKNKICWIQEIYITCKTNFILYCIKYFLNSTYFIFNQFKSNKFSGFFCCWIYIFAKLFQTGKLKATSQIEVTMPKSDLSQIFVDLSMQYSEDTYDRDQDPTVQN